MIVFSQFLRFGDALLFNTIVVAKAEETGKKIWVATTQKELLRGNPHVRIIPFFKKKSHLNIVLKRLKWLGIHIEYADFTYPPLGERSILQVFAKKAGLQHVPEVPRYCGDLDIHQLPSDVQGVILDAKVRNKKIVIMQSGAEERWTKNKSWFHDRYLDVVEALYEDCMIIHAGLERDPYIRAHYDTRGKLSIHQLFVLFNQADLYIGTVGFMMHIAATFRVKSVIIYGGFEAPWQSGYSYNINLYSDIPCAPCWQVTCTNPMHRQCTRMITSTQVIAAAREVLADLDTIPPSVK